MKIRYDQRGKSQAELRKAEAEAELAEIALAEKKAFKTKIIR